MKRVLLIALFLVFTLGAMAAGAGIYKWTSAPTHKPNLPYFLIEGLLTEYISYEGNPGQECLRFRGMQMLSTDWRANYNSENGTWMVRSTGKNCTGIESWEIDDATGAITYLGSSTSP